METNEAIATQKLIRKSFTESEWRFLEANKTFLTWVASAHTLPQADELIVTGCNLLMAFGRLERFPTAQGVPTQEPMHA